MKIIHIIPNLRKGGAERLVIDIVGELRKIQGIEVRLVLFRNEMEYDIEIIRDIVKIIEASVELSFLKRNKLNIEKLQAFFEEFKPDIIHSHLFEAEIVTRSCLYPKAKWVSHCHDNMIQFKKFGLHTFKSKSAITNFFEKKYLFRRYKANMGNHFIAISNNTKEYFENKTSGYSIKLLNNAINYNKFYFVKRFNLAANKIKLINIGSFVAKKNQQLLIGIAYLLKSKNINFELHLLGDGVLRGSIEEMVQKQNLQDYIFFHGNVNNVQEFLWKSDIYIHTARYEPLGLVLIEAMAAGLPVISLDGKGNRDLIDGKNGYMIYEENPELFIEKILFLWNNNVEYYNRSSYAQKFAKNYDIPIYVNTLINYYKTLLE